jgi:hypothetical protein
VFKAALNVFQPPLQQVSSEHPFADPARFRGAERQCADAVAAAASVLPPSAPSSARSTFRTPRASRQQQQQQRRQQQQQQFSSVSAGTALRQRLMQGMEDDEREVLIKTLAAL